MNQRDYKGNLRHIRNDVSLKSFIDNEAEINLLSSIYMETDKVYDAVVKKEDFFSPIHQEIFEKLIQTVHEDDNASALYMKLAKGEVRDYFTENIANTYMYDFEESQSLVMELSLKRRVYEMCNTLPNMIYPWDSSHVLDYLSNELSNLSTNENSDDTVEPIVAGENALTMIEEIKDGKYLTGVESGISNLDDIIGSFGNGQFCVLGAPSSHGKTSFALSCIYNQLQKGLKVGLFSLEMQSKELMLRLGSINSLKFSGAKKQKARYDAIVKNLASKEEVELMQDSIVDCMSLPILFNEDTRLTVYQLCRIATKWKKRHDIDAIYVDYIQLVSGDKSGNREREVATITKELKGLAMRLDIPVIGLSQLNRHIDARKTIPVASDLRESSALEHDSDKIILFWRPWMYDKQNRDLSKNKAQINIAKNRQGISGVIDVYFDDEITYFTNENNYGNKSFKKNESDEFPF